MNQSKPNSDDRRFFAQYVDRRGSDPIRVIVRELECVKVSPQGYSRTWREVGRTWEIKEDIRLKYELLPKTEKAALIRLQKNMLNPCWSQIPKQDCIDVIVEAQRMIDAASWNDEHVCSLNDVNEGRIKRRF